MAEPVASQTLAELISNNWPWIVATFGAAMTTVLGLIYRVFRWCAAKIQDTIEWTRPKLNEIYTRHIELVSNLNVAIPDMAKRLKTLEETQNDSHKRIVDVHRLITLDEEWDREKKEVTR